MKKVFALLLVLVMTLSLVACGAPSDAPVDDQTETGPQTLRVLLEAEPESLDPKSTEFFSSYVHAPMTTAMFIPLLYKDAAGEIVPGLATAWDWIDDTHLRLTIRDDVYSAAGTKIVASDVLATFKGASGGQASSFFTAFDFDNFVVESETSIVLALNTPYPSLLEAFLSPVYCVYSETDYAALEDMADISSLCTGRYVFKEWLPAQHISAVKNENYFDAENAGYYDEIVFTFNSDASARALALQSGDVDIVSNIDVSQIATLESAGYTANLRDTEDTVTLYLNCSKSPFDNEKVRQAVCMLLNREAIRAVLYNGNGSVVDTVFSAATMYYQECDAVVDVDAAKTLLAEAGYADGLTFTISGLPNTSLAAEVIQANLGEAGITVEINTMDFGAYIGSRTSGNYDALVGVAGASDYLNVLKAYDGRLSVEEAFGGALYYGDDEAIALLDAAYGELELKARQAAVAQLCDYLTEKGVMIGLCSVSRCDPARGDLTGMAFCTAPFVDVSTMHPAG